MAVLSYVYILQQGTDIIYSLCLLFKNFTKVHEYCPFILLSDWAILIPCLLAPKMIDSPYVFIAVQARAQIRL